MQPQTSELDALRDSAILLKFAVENIKDEKDLPQATVSTIATAWKQREDDKWDPDISAQFWLAYVKLCTLIKPVSLDTLIATKQERSVKKWIWFGPERRVLLAHRSARRYLILMLTLLGLSLPCGFVTSTATTLSSEIQELNDKSSLIAADIRKQIDDLWPAFGAHGELNMPKNEETRQKVSLLNNREQDLWYAQDKMIQKTVALAGVTFLGLVGYTKGSLAPWRDLSMANDELLSYYASRRDVTELQQKALISSNIISGYILPVLLGAMGSCAYVIRLISDEIKDTTFSSSAPIRHLVRVALGALAGVAIGYSGVAAGSVSGAALSFIAGYAIEPVFATFDSIAQKFR